MKTAIMVDGGFYRKVGLPKLVKKNETPEESAQELISYCKRHLTQYKAKSHDEESVYSELYRIFYYDCPPLEKQIYHPLHKRSYNFAKTAWNKWMKRFLNELTKQRKVALRLGNLSDNDFNYNLKYESTKKLLNGTLTIEDLTDDDFTLSVVQKGVDMKIGVDIASLSYKKQVDQIVLIAGDSDFVPASKMARREGIDFILDSLGNPIKQDLFIHIDGLNYKDNRLMSKFNKKERTDKSQK